MKTFTHSGSRSGVPAPPDNSPLCQFTEQWPHPSQAHGSTVTRARVRVRGNYGLTNRACLLTVSGGPDLALIDFHAGDAEVLLVLSNEPLLAVTKALMARRTPAEIACIVEALGGAR